MKGILEGNEKLVNMRCSEFPNLLSIKNEGEEDDYNKKVDNHAEKQNIW